VQKGQTVPLKLNVFTNSSGLYELKVYSPEGKLLFSGLKPVRENGLVVWTVTPETEVKKNVGNIM